MRQLEFVIYLVSFFFVVYSLVRQWLLLNNTINGTRFTQTTFLVFNIAFSLWLVGKLLDMAGFALYFPDQIRAMLIFVMSTVGFVFYLPKKR